VALSATNRRPPAGEAEQYQDEPSKGMRIGIALSGGGIRSAAFNLGALQALQEKGILERAEYLAAVSGGNYIASALTISAAYAEDEYDSDKARWSAGSPEERYLRNNTDYLAPGWTGRVWLGLSVAYGFLLNYLPFLLSSFLIGRVIGWGLHHVFDVKLEELRFEGIGLPTSWVLRAPLALLGGCLALALLLVAWRRVNDGFRSVGDYGKSRSEPAASRLIGVAIAIVVILALPGLAALYAASSRWLLTDVFGDPPEAFDGAVGRIEAGALWLVGALLVAAAALWLSRRLRARQLMLGLSSLAGAGLLLVPLLSSLDYSARHGMRSVGDVVVAGIALGVIVLMGVFVHSRRYSLHLFYRERLNSAFALRRVRDAKRRIIAESIPYDQKLSFSGIGADAGDRMPKLVVCCAVNLTTDEVPAGRFAESFTFTHDMSGSPLFGYHPTEQFEAEHGPSGTKLTLPSLMAVSGAALSPIMGRFTYPPMRFLMALTNVRLGVWVPSPLHESWNAQPDRGGTWWRRMWRTVVDGWREPGAYYVLREALGVLRPDDRFIYLSDGGHWENLGVVELLRRHCTHVLCFDASSDVTGSGQDVGRAIALARSDLGVEIELDPRPTIADDEGYAADVAVRGVISYPNRTDEAKLVYAKAVLTKESSWDLHAFRQRDHLFPNHPTGQQMFTNEQFEAYRTLGHAAGRRSIDLLNAAPVLLGNAGRSNGLAQRPPTP
jgi:patatin-like phospholipase